MLEANQQNELETLVSTIHIMSLANFMNIPRTIRFGAIGLKLILECSD